MKIRTNISRPYLRIEKKTVEDEGDNYTNVIGAFGSVTKGLLKGLKDLEVGGRVETIQQ